MYYVIEFDPISGKDRKQIVEAYRKFASYFESKMPRFKFVGLFARNVLLGPRPHYLAIWEFPSYDDLDRWNEFFAGDKEGQRVAKELSGLVAFWEAKVMTKLI